MKSILEVDISKCVISRFYSNQTLTIIQELKNMGIGLKILINNNWETLSEYNLPFERFIILYDKNFQISDIGVY